MADKPNPKLSDNFKVFQLAEHDYRRHVARPEFGVTIDQVMDDAYWSIVASKVRPGDHIDIHPEGMTYYAELLVVDSGKNFATTRLLRFVDLLNDGKAPNQAPIQAEADLGKYEAVRNGAWFRVVRKSDREVMKSGFRTLAAAEAWAKENLVTA